VKVLLFCNRLVIHNISTKVPESTSHVIKILKVSLTTLRNQSVTVFSLHLLDAVNVPWTNDLTVRPTLPSLQLNTVSTSHGYQVGIGWRTSHKHDSCALTVKRKKSTAVHGEWDVYSHYKTVWICNFGAIRTSAIHTEVVGRSAASRHM
jgi:hypothetical protein